MKSRTERVPVGMTDTVRGRPRPNVTEFMKIYERPELLLCAKNCQGDADAVFSQLDTWDTHLFLLRTVEGEDGRWEVLMFDAENRRRGARPLASAIEDALGGSCDEEKEYGSIAEALDDICAYGGANELVTPLFVEALAAHREAERIAGMSEYARKKYLQSLEQ